MIFEDYFDRYLNEQGFPGRSQDQIRISKEEYIKLKEIADNYEAVRSQAETLRLENKELKDILKDLKEDARGFKELQEEKEKYLRALLRARADLENYQKASHRENERYKERALEGILKSLISHHEDLLRAREVLESSEVKDSVRKGFDMLISNFEKVLEEQGVKAMNCVGEKFDPYKHEALYTMESDRLPENTIMEELHHGYYLKDKVLRPAKVVVSKLGLNNQFNKKKEEITNKQIKEVE